MLPIVTGEFRAVKDPELRFAPSGVAVASIRAVAQKQKKNDAGEWVDDKVLWVTLTAFNRLAENIAESIEQGDLLVVIGKVQTEEWEDREGNKRQSTAIVLDHIGPSLKFNPAVPQRARRDGGSNQQSSSSGTTQQQSDHGDPWAAPTTTPTTEEPPF